MINYENEVLVDLVEIAICQQMLIFYWQMVAIARRNPGISKDLVYYLFNYVTFSV